MSTVSSTAQSLGSLTADGKRVVDEVITLPPLIGSREAADVILSRIGEVRGKRVVIDCRGLVSASQSFADQLVVRLIQEKGAAALDVIAPYDDFWEFLSESAREIGAVERLEKAPAARLVQR
jgi:hypothetical protein